MIPEWISAEEHEYSIPRESGDDPDLRLADQFGKKYSPRERG